MEDRKRGRGRERGGVREEEEEGGAEIPSVVKETGRFPDAGERERERRLSRVRRQRTTRAQ